MPPTISLRHIAVPRVTVARAPGAPARAAAPGRVQLRRGRARRRPDDGRGHAVRAAGAVQTRRGRLGAAGELRRDRGPAPAAPAPRSRPWPVGAVRAGRAQRAGRAGASRERRAVSRRPPADALARTIEALLFLSPDPLSAAELADADAGRGGRGRGRRWRCSPSSYAPGAARDRAARARRRLDVRDRPRHRGRRAGACSAARASSTLTPAQAETLAIVAYLQPVSRPEITRIRGVSADSAVDHAARARPDRGGRPLAVRRRPLPHDARSF